MGGEQIRDLYAKSPYDISLYANFCSVLGPWWTWLIPTRYGMPVGIAAGCIFDINKDHPLYLATLERSNRGGSEPSIGSYSRMPNEDHGSPETNLLVNNDYSDEDQAKDLDPIRPA